jgi:entericidin B
MQRLVRIRRKVTRILLSMTVLAGAGLQLSGCNTTAGLGQDVSATGRAVTNSAEKVKQGL